MVWDLKGSFVNNNLLMIENLLDVEEVWNNLVVEQSIVRGMAENDVVTGEELAELYLAIK